MGSLGAMIGNAPALSYVPSGVLEGLLLVDARLELVGAVRYGGQNYRW